MLSFGLCGGKRMLCDAIFVAVVGSALCVRKKACVVVCKEKKCCGTQSWLRLSAPTE